MEQTIDEQLPRPLRIFVAICLFMAMLVAPIFMMIMLYFNGCDGLTPLIKANPQAWLGIPWAGGAALIVVLLFKPIFGDMEFKVPGIDFKGSSGPVVLWALCFLAEVAGINTLYSPPATVAPCKDEAAPQKNTTAGLPGVSYPRADG